ncbi:MAG: MFS transporter [Deltaproteobacteria bacterium]|nr:MFS transporter [Deltaproteobacteria bacterium]
MSSPPPAVRTTPPGAFYAVAVLTGMNLLNYVDRYVPSAVKDLFKRDLGMSDADTSLPLTAFVFVYMIMSPVFGSLSDKVPRRLVIAGGVALWSLATAAAAAAVGFWSFLGARALVGVGEAAYATLAPALIADFYPPERRNRILTLFYVAIPVGAALGFAVGGVVGEHFGWRMAFLACGLPGLLAAGAALAIKDPGRGTFDDDKDATPPAWPAALKALASNRVYVFTVVGYTLVTFASGALADWFPTLLSRLRGMSVDEAGSITGTATVVGGLGGTLVGGLLADRVRARTRNPYLAVSGLSIVAATVLAAIGLQVEGKWAIAGFILLTQFFMWFYNGPVNSVLVNCVPSALRARAFSFSILCIHFLGDAVSPFIVGTISDLTGSLLLAISVVPIALAGGAAVWLYAWRTLPDDRAPVAS